MRFDLEQYSKFKEKGLKSLKAYDYKEARYCLLMAAKYLLLAARKSTGTQKKEMQEKALHLRNMALAIDFSEAKYKPAEDIKSIKSLDENEMDSQKWLLTEKPNIRFDQIAGLEKVKEEIRLKVIYPFEHSDAAERFKKNTGGGILLYGPPGNGKTMIAKAIATELDAQFFSVKSSDIMSKWVGEAEKNFARLFELARQYPISVIFIDETEALVGKRGSGSTVMDRVIPEFLSQVDGLESRKNCILLLGATNRPWAMDKAALRPGRFATKIYIGLPDQKAREQILHFNLDGIPMEPGINYTELAEKLNGYSGADIVMVCEKATDYPFQRQIRSGSEAILRKSELDRAIAEVSPSVDEGMLKKFKVFSEGRNGGE